MTKSSSLALPAPAPQNNQIQFRRLACSNTTKQPNPFLFQQYKTTKSSSRALPDQHRKTIKSSSGALPVPASQTNPVHAPVLFRLHKATESSSRAFPAPTPQNNQIQLRRPSCSGTTKQPHPAPQNNPEIKSGSGALPPQGRPSCSSTTKQPNQVHVPFLLQHHTTTKSSSGAIPAPTPQDDQIQLRCPSCSNTRKILKGRKAPHV